MTTSHPPSSEEIKEWGWKLEAEIDVLTSARVRFRSWLARKVARLIASDRIATKIVSDAVQGPTINAKNFQLVARESQARYG